MAEEKLIIQINNEQLRNDAQEAISQLNRIAGAYNDLKSTVSKSNQFDGLSSGLKGLEGAFDIAKGAARGFTDSNQELARVQAKLTDAMSVLSGAQKVVNTLNSQSAFRSQTVAKVTEWWTAAQMKLSTSLGLSAVGARALMGALTGGLSIAIGFVISLISKWRDKQEQAREEARKAQEEQQHYFSSIASNLAEPITSLKNLQAAWTDLGDDMGAKNKFLKDNAAEFEKLGLSVQSVADAENILVKNTDAVIEAFMHRARASAATDLAKEKYKEHFSKKFQSEQALTPTQDNIDEAKKNLTLKKIVKGPFKLGFSRIKFSEKDINNKAKEIAKEVSENLLAESNKLLSEGDMFFKIGRDEKQQASDILKLNGIKEHNSSDKNNKSSRSGKSAFNQAEYDAKIEQQLVESKNIFAGAEIQAKPDGFEKEMSQIKHNYEVKKQLIKTKEKELLAAFRESEFSKWKEENPNGNEKEFAAVFAQTKSPDSINSIINNLNDENEATKLAEQKKILDKHLEQYLTYEQQRNKIVEKYAQQRDALAIKDAEGNYVPREGVEQENLDKLNAAEKDALDPIDIQLAMRREEFQKWSEDIADASIRQLMVLLNTANAELDRLKKEDPGNSSAIIEQQAKISHIQGNIESLNTRPDSNSIKDWKALSGSIGELGGVCHSAAKAIGGTAGETLDFIGSMAGATKTIIDGVVSLSQGASTAINATSAAAVTAVSTMEKATVILAIISAAFQVFSMIFGGRKNHMAEFRKEMKKLNKELEATKHKARINSKDYDSAFGNNEWGKAISNMKVADDSLKRYGKTLQDIKAHNTRWVIEPRVGGGFKLLRKEFDTSAEAIQNMQMQVRHSTWFRSAKYKSLKDAVPELFDQDGQVNKDALEKFVESKSFSKLSRQNQEYLKALADDWKAYEEAVDSVRKYLSGIFGELGNTMTDALVDAFANGTDAAQAFTNSVSGMLEKLAKEMITSITFGELFSKAEKDMLDIMKDDTLDDQIKYAKITNVLSNVVDSAVKGQAEAEVLMTNLQKIAKDKGLDIFSSDKAQREASAKGFASMSQDSADELNGRFTAIQGHTFSINEKMGIIVNQKAEIVNIITPFGENLNMLRENSNIALKHLSNIDTNTGRLYAIESTLNDINHKGVLIRS